MKLVMTLLARDEADILDTHLAFHLNAGVDFVIATDHRSQDGTTDILRAYEREGCLHVIREQSERWQQAAWVTRMARLAATDFGADWVINSDADEFWWPRGGDLKSVLAAVPEPYGVVRAFWRNFIPRPDDGRPFHERMTVRLAGRAPINDPTSQYRPSFKVAHRADPFVIVEQGNHGLVDSPLLLLPDWYPIELFHFPLRSFSQYERRYRLISEALGKGRRADHVRVERARATGQLVNAYRALVTDDEQLAAGLAEELLVEDCRLRDLLRGLRPRRSEADERLPLPKNGAPRLDFPRPSLEDEISYAEEAAAAADAEVIRLARLVDDLEARCRV